MPAPDDVLPPSLRLAGVTAREADVFWLVAERLHNREIADRLHLSERTVESHVSALISKLEVDGRRGLIDAAATLARAPARRPIRRPLSSFIGRATELGELQALVAANRLVTLVGPAGTGKTRLALRLAEVITTDSTVVLVDLATAKPGAKVDRPFADALGVMGGGEQLREVLRDTIAHLRCWLIVDNCEHVAAATAELLDDLFASSDQLTVLATSVRPLDLPGEVVYALQPLAVPPSTDAPRSVLDAAAGRLFADRAAAADPRFAVTSANARDIAELCRRLDGLPLAIELAAARLRTFSPAELLARLDDRFAVLAGTSRAPATRHLSLEAAIQWSYDLLDADERVLFERCGVFPGPFDYDTAVAVVGRPPLRRADLARLFPRLLDRSLLSATRAAERTEYRMLDSIRQYAMLRLEEHGHADRAIEEHARHHLRHAPTLVPDLQGRDQPAAMRWFDVRWLDLRVAMQWALDRGEIEEAWGFVAGVGTAWEIIGMRDELFDWLDVLLASPLPKGALGRRAVMTAALLLSLYRDSSRAMELVAGLTPEPADLADAAMTNFAVGTTMLRGSPEPGPLLDAAVAGFAQLGDEWHRAAALRSRAEAMDEMEPALALLDQAATSFGAIGDVVSVANCRHLMASRCVLAGVGLDDAERWLTEARELALRAGSHHEYLHAELFSAQLEQRRGGSPAARERFEALVPEFRRIGDRRCLGRSLVGLGTALLAAGDPFVADRRLQEAVRVLESVGPTSPLVVALRLIARTRHASGESILAARILGAADAVAAELTAAARASLPSDDDLRTALDEALGARAVGDLLAEGRGLRPEVLVAHGA